MPDGRRTPGSSRRRSPRPAQRARPVFEDRFGFFAAYYGMDASSLEAQVADLGTRWETPRIAFKPYPACHFVHSSLDAAASLLARASAARGRDRAHRRRRARAGHPARARAGRGEARPAHGVRREVQPAVLDRRADRARARRRGDVHRVRHPRSRRARAGSARRARPPRVPDLPALVSRLGQDRDALGRACRARARASARGAREPDARGRGRGEVPRERRARARPRRGRHARAGTASLEDQDDLALLLAAAATLPAMQRA